MNALAAETVIIEMQDLNTSTWTASDKVFGDVNVKHEHIMFYESIKFRINLSFKPEKGHTYKVEHKIIAYLTIVKSCFWYDTLRLIDVDLNKVIAEKTAGVSGDCVGRPRYSTDFEDTTADFYWQEEVELLKPEVQLNAENTEGFAPLTVEFTGGCRAISKTAKITSCVLNYGDGIKEPFTGKAMHVYSNAGKYIAVLTAIDSFGQSETKTLNINAASFLRSQLLSVNVKEAETTKALEIEIACITEGKATLTLRDEEGKPIETREVSCTGKQLVILKPVKSAGLYSIEARIPNCEGQCFVEKQFIIREGKEEKEAKGIEAITLIVFVVIVIIIGLLFHEKLKESKTKKTTARFALTQEKEEELKRKKQ